VESLIQLNGGRIFLERDADGFAEGFCFLGIHGLSLSCGMG
jgi:hypothetical protein